MKSLGAVPYLISSLDSRTRIHRRIRYDSQSRITVNCRGRNRAHKLASDGTSTMITKRGKKGRGGLDTPVHEVGSSLSAGQRQFLCFAGAFDCKSAANARVWYSPRCLFSTKVIFAV